MNISKPEEEDKYIQLLAYHQFGKILQSGELSKLQRTLLNHDVTLLNYPNIEIYHKGKLLKEKIKDINAYERLVDIINTQILEIIEFKKREEIKKIKEKKKRKAGIKEMHIDGHDVMSFGNLKSCKLVGDILELITTKVQDNKTKYRTKAKQVSLLMEIINELRALERLSDIPL